MLYLSQIFFISNFFSSQIFLFQCFDQPEFLEIKCFIELKYLSFQAKIPEINPSPTDSGKILKSEFTEAEKLRAEKVRDKINAVLAKVGNEYFKYL